MLEEATVPDLLRAMRPHQWTKNLLVFAGAVFSLRLLDPEALFASGATFVLFCLASSSVYLFNDIRDRDKDRLHPHKRTRPIAAGDVSVRTAAVASVGLALLALAGAVWLGPPTLVLLFAAYLVKQLAYTFGLKRVPILDALIVAAGFVLRAVAGSIAIGEPASAWLLICTIFFALFISLAKRRQEIATLQGGAEHRASLEGYDLGLMDQLVAIATSSSLMSYALYTLDESTIAHFRTELLPLTLPFVIYAFFRFLYITRTRPDLSDPARAVVQDPGMLLAVLGWGGAVLAILYWG